MAQHIVLQGVVDNGGCFHPLVLRDTRREIAFPRMADVIIEVCVTYPSGQPVMEGEDLKLGVRSPSCVASGTLQKIGVFAKGKGVFTLSGVDTAQFCPGRYIYDIWLTVAGKAYQIVGISPLVIQANVVANP